MWHENPQRRPVGRKPGPGRSANPEPEDIVQWAESRLGFIADTVQAQVLRSTTRRGMLNCCRQWGKSTVAAAKAVHHAQHAAGSLTLVVSPSKRQSGELVRKASNFLVRLGTAPKGDGQNATSIELPNRSRIVGLPGNEATIRGFSAVSLLLVDEASRVDEELYRAIRPMLAVSNGVLWLMSTPFNRQGFFWDTWSRGGAVWERFQVPATECPRIHPEFLAEERRTLDRRTFGREYLCQFDSATRTVFDDEAVGLAVTEEVRPLIL